MDGTSPTARGLTPLGTRNVAPFRAQVPGSKSLTNRGLALAATRPGVTRVSNALHAQDTELLATCLGGFDGIETEKTEAGFTVTRRDGPIGAAAEPLYIGGAGTPARFLISFAADAQGVTEITGNARLCERPMGHILEALDRIGITYECLATDGCLPVRVTGGESRGTEWEVDGSISSQFVSSLILHASRRPVGSDPITVRVTGHLVSRPYVEMTEQIMRASGLTVEQVDDKAWRVTPGRPNVDTIPIETDASGMSYFLAAAAITGTTAVIPGIGHDSRQGDVGFARILEQMGARLEIGDDHVTVTGTGTLRGVDVDMELMPDVVLTLAPVAALAEGPTRVTNIANLRVKECDRIAAIATELGRMGIKAVEGPDWVEIHPGATPQPAKIETYDDHRVAMAFSLIGLIHPGIEILDPGCVRKSFPKYWDEYDRFIAHHTNV